MTIILDECLPKRLQKFFKPHDCWTVPQIGLAGFSDKQLLEALDQKRIDVFITIDGNIEYQQQFHDRTFGTIVLRAPSNRYEDLKHLMPHVNNALVNIQAGKIIHIP